MTKASLWNRLVENTLGLFRSDVGILANPELDERRHVVVLGPEQTPSGPHFYNALRNFNVIVTGLGNTPIKDLSRHVSESLDRYLFVPELQSRNALRRALGLLTFEFGKIDTLHSFLDDWASLEIELRRDFCIDGMDATQREQEESRSLIRERLTEAKIPCPSGRDIPDFKALGAFCSAADYPVMVKPEYGSGLRGVCRIDSQSDLRDIGPHLSYPAVAEKHVAGPLFNLEGLIDHEGQIIFEQWNELGQCPLESQAGKGPNHFYSLLEVPEQALKIAKAIIDLFQIQSRFFQIEFVQSSADVFTVIDVNWRLPGGFSADVMNYSCDIDVFQLWAQVLEQRVPEDFSYKRKYFCAHVGRRDSRNYQFTDKDLALQVKAAEILAVKSLSGSLAKRYGDRVVIVRSDKLGDISEAIRVIEKGPS